MTTTANIVGARGGHHKAEAVTPGQAATRRWFPDEVELERRIDAVVKEVAKRRSDEASATPTVPRAYLFGEDAIEPTQTRRRSATRSLNEIASQAYLAMLRAMPEDHVVIDPEANQEFINRCRLLGASVSEYLLNKALLNVRKSGKWHRGIERGTVSHLDREVLDRVGYAAEMAARIVQMRAIEAGADYPTVDRILCDPTLRELFDEAVCGISPGFSIYEYRLAAFSYRKSGRESTVRLGQSSAPDWEVDDVPFRSLDPDDAPAVPGVYRIDAGSRVLFVSATLNLRSRLLSHLAVGERQALFPPTLWDPPRGKLMVRWFEAPVGWKPRRADAVAQRMKSEERAMFNLYSRTA